MHGDFSRTAAPIVTIILQVYISFSRLPKQTSAELSLGDTACCATTTAAVVKPHPARPVEGFLKVKVDVSPLASEQVDFGRPAPEAVGLGRAVERAIRDSRALDVESLCIEAGERVWEIECYVIVTCLGGNALDAAILASIASLRHFRRPEVTLSGDGATVKGYSEGVPTPLSVHHTPIAVSFGLVRVPPRPAAAAGEDGAASSRPSPFSMDDAPSGIVTQSSIHSGATGLVAVMDPTDREEVVSSGRLTFCFTAGGRELCFLDKPGGAAVPTELFDACLASAYTHARVVSRGLDEALRQAELRYKQEDMRRHALAHGYKGAGSGWAALGGARGKGQGKAGTSAAPLLDQVSRVLDVFAPRAAQSHEGLADEGGEDGRADGMASAPPGLPSGSSAPGPARSDGRGVSVSIAAAVESAEQAHSGSAGLPSTGALLARAGDQFVAVVGRRPAPFLRRSSSASSEPPGHDDLGHAQADGIYLGQKKMDSESVSYSKAAVPGGPGGRMQGGESADDVDELAGLAGGSSSFADLASMEP